MTRNYYYILAPPLPVRHRRRCSTLALVRVVRDGTQETATATHTSGEAQDVGIEGHELEDGELGGG